MKIQKFNESNGVKDYIAVIITCDSEVENFAIFESEENADNWVLNQVNERLSGFENATFSSGSEFSSTGIVQNSDGDDVFINVKDAIDWFNDDSWSIFYKTADVTKNVDLEFGVEFARRVNKYNL